MDKQHIAPDDFFATIVSLVRDFEMSGQASFNTNWTGKKRLSRTMSWNIKYGYGTGDDSCSTSLFMPHTFAGLLHEKEWSSGRARERRPANPMSVLSQHQADWLEQDNALLANCVPFNESIVIRPKKTARGFQITQRLAAHDTKIFQAKTWFEVLDKCVANALSAGVFEFYMFEDCAEENKRRVLDVLRTHPVHNQHTTEMYKVDLCNHVDMDVAAAKKPKKI